MRVLFLLHSWLLGWARWRTNCPPRIHPDLQNTLQRCDWNHQQIRLHQEWVCILPFCSPLASPNWSTICWNGCLGSSYAEAVTSKADLVLHKPDKHSYVDLLQGELGHRSNKARMIEGGGIQQIAVRLSLFPSLKDRESNIFWQWVLLADSWQLSHVALSVHGTKVTVERLAPAHAQKTEASQAAKV